MPRPSPIPSGKAHPLYGAVLAGDHVYVRHPEAGPMAVRVLAAGRDGVTAQCDRGGRYRVPYGAVLGHRARMLQSWKVVDRGAEGAILEGPDGARHYVAGELPTAMPDANAAAEPPPADDPLTGGLDRLAKPERTRTMTKAALLFFKASTVDDRPGPARKDTSGTPRRGGADQKQDRSAGRAGGSAAAGGEGGEPPAATMKHGDTVRFRHGDVEGEGEIVASGPDGVTLKAKDGREHQVRHEHLCPPGAGGADPTDKPRKGGRDPASKPGDRGDMTKAMPLILFARA